MNEEKFKVGEIARWSFKNPSGGIQSYRFEILNPYRKERFHTEGYYRARIIRDDSEVDMDPFYCIGGTYEVQADKLEPDYDFRSRFERPEIL